MLKVDAAHQQDLQPKPPQSQFENFSHVYRDNCGFFWSVTNPHNSFYDNYYVSKSPVIAFFLLAQLGHFKQCTGHIDMLNVGLLTMDNRQGTVRFVASLRYVRTYTNTDLTLPFMYVSNGKSTHMQAYWQYLACLT